MALRAAHGSPSEGRRLVRGWLYGLAVLVVLMVAVGGATRLTGSGLSITEWRPVTGAIPPLSETGWAAEFEKYRGSSQFRNLNPDMEIGAFKQIYWWEWGHRQLGRLIGLYVFLPLLWFWWTSRISSGFAAKLLGVGALGGLQAGIGWIMVASGLVPGMVAVAPIKLTLHLLVASLILALIVWLASGLDAPERRDREPRAARGLAFGLLGLVALQIGLGGLVAGSKAGLTYNTWPLMDGRLVPSPDALLVVRPWIENFVDNPTLVQFNHRLVAYLVVGLALVQAWIWWREAPGSPGFRRARLLVLIGLTQAALGITTLLLAVPLWAGLGHQLLAMGLLAAATMHTRACAGSRRLARSPAIPAGTTLQPS